MKKVLNTKHTFNGNVLNVQYSLLSNYVNCATVTAVDIYEYDADGYTHLQRYSSDEADVADRITPSANGSITFVFPDNTDHLAKCVYTVVPGSACQTPCCMDLDANGNWLVTEYYLDLHVYNRNLVESIKLQCDNCDVPMDVVSKLLKVFTVTAAAEADSPMLEMIYSKIVCNNTSLPSTSVHTSNCNCNG